MRITHILEATQGGTRRHVLDLIGALMARGVACDLVYSTLRNPNFSFDAQILEARGVRVWQVPMARGWNSAIDAPALRQLRAIIKTSRPDIVHLHSTKAGMLGRLSCGTLSAPRRPAVVYTPHCIAFDTRLPTFQRCIARQMESVLAPMTTAFIAVSQHENRALRAARIGTSSKRHLVYNGIDIGAFDALNFPSAARLDCFVVGCFGRLTKQKNQASLLHALPQLMAVEPRARLLLVGGGEDETALRALATRLKITDRIEWTGELDEPRPLYARCEIIAQPSHWEGCPYSVLEAMAARRAIVAAPVGGVREVLGECCGVLERPAQFGARLSELALDDERRQALGKAARARLEAHFTLEKMVEGTLHVYQSALKTRDMSA